MFASTKRQRPTSPGALSESSQVTQRAQHARGSRHSYLPPGVPTTGPWAAADGGGGGAGAGQYHATRGYGGHAGGGGGGVAPSRESTPRSELLPSRDTDTTDDITSAESGGGGDDDENYYWVCFDEDSCGGLGVYFVAACSWCSGASSCSAACWLLSRGLFWFVAFFALAVVVGTKIRRSETETTFYIIAGAVVSLVCCGRVICEYSLDLSLRRHPAPIIFCTWKEHRVSCVIDNGARSYLFYLKKKSCFLDC